METSNNLHKTLTEKELEEIERIKTEVHKIPNFPSEGILFYDIFSILRNPELTEILFSISEKIITEMQKDPELSFNTIVGLESRGFLLGMVLADRLKLPFVPIRKKNKLPGDCYKVNYTTEYSNDAFEIQKNAINEKSKILIIDDLLATGGTLKAAESLAKLANAKVNGFFTVFEIEFLKGKEKLENKDKSFSLIQI